MIDLHSHILPGVDDGAATLEDSFAIARACVEDGIELVAATPHVRRDYPTEARTMELAVGELRQALARAGIPLDVRKGGEIALERLGRLSPAELRRFGLGGNPSYLLVEFPYTGWPDSLGAAVFHLRGLGITPVLAHPERNAWVQKDPERLRPVVEVGALVQLTAGSLDGRIGRSAQRTGLELIATGLAHMLASDAHRASVREAGMSAAVEAVADAELARWLAEDVPRAILTGATLPARPAQSQGGGP